MEDTGAILQAQHITHLKQVKPEEIRELSEKIIETDKLMTECTEELEDLSQGLYCLSATKDKYDEAAKKVKGQIRSLMPKM